MFSSFCFEMGSNQIGPYHFQLNVYVAITSYHVMLLQNKTEFKVTIHTVIVVQFYPDVR